MGTYRCVPLGVRSSDPRGVSAVVTVAGDSGVSTPVVVFTEYCEIEPPPLDTYA